MFFFGANFLIRLFKEHFNAIYNGFKLRVGGFSGANCQEFNKTKRLQRGTKDKVFVCSVYVDSICIVL